MSPSTTKFTHNRARTHERLGTTATKQNNNLAIVNRSRVSCAHCVESIYGPKYYTVTLKSKLRSLKVTGNGTIGWIMHDLLLVELFDVKYYRDLEI